MFIIILLKSVVLLFSSSSILFSSSSNLCFETCFKSFDIYVDWFEFDFSFLLFFLDNHVACNYKI